jgi:pyridoxine kinase
VARILILSSFVAASRVGGGAQSLALARLGLEPVLVPTVLMGRHPGHGAPGGGPVTPETFAAMLGGIEAQGLFSEIDAVITGHFSMPEQVAVAADAVLRVKGAAPGARVVVDPVMGDADKGLYVREAVAEAIASALVPLADVVAPNAWELSRLTGRPVDDPAGAVAAARALGRPTLVSSIRAGGDIGVVYTQADQAWIARHPPAPSAPKGTGDLLTALFVAGLLRSGNAVDALAAATAATAEAVRLAGGADELPLAALPTALPASANVALEPLDG